jgi:hypothetical protein
MRMLLAGGALVLAVALAGCGSTGSFTALSTKNVNLADMKLDQTRQRGHGVGRDCMQIIVLVPTSGPPSVKEAIDRAIESKNGNVLLDARIRHDMFYIPLIYGRECWTAEGAVYDTY